MESERSEPVIGSGERGPIQRGVSRDCPHVQLSHEGVQKFTTTGQASWKLPIRALLLGLSPGCFEKRFSHNAEALRPPKRAEICIADASQGEARLLNTPMGSCPVRGR
jgi:hypothetical protein